MISTYDSGLAARIIRSAPLYYRAGADPSNDRPTHVRAASSMAWFGSTIAVIQDDAHFIALIDPKQCVADACMLPAGYGGRRQFDDLLGNKQHKLDLEACVTITIGGTPTLLAIGSGSSPVREQIALIQGLTSQTPQITLIQATQLYATLRATTTFAGSDLNIEGALFLGNHLRLFGRGNGAPQNNLRPIDATCDLEWSQLLAYLHDPSLPPPLPTSIIQYDLGQIGSMRLSFTDAALGPACILYSATAEASPDATRDGPVAGSAIGILADQSARWAILSNSDGTRFDGKVEGLLLDPTDPYHAYLVVDRDNPLVASELCEVELAGAWYPTSFENLSGAAFSNYTAS